MSIGRSGRYERKAQPEALSVTAVVTEHRCVKCGGQSWRCGTMRFTARHRADRRLILGRVRDDGCGGLAGKAELLIGIMLMKGR